MKDALDELCAVVTNNENKDPDTCTIVLGDFNQANLKTVLPNFDQVVTCPTRETNTVSNTLDHCYCKIKNSYRSFQRAALGNSDHSVILLVPKFDQKYKQSKPVTTEVTSWNDAALSKLQSCYETTDWSVFNYHCDNIDEYADVVNNYITFCEELCLPKKSVTRYSNNKQWCDKAVLNTLIAKDNAYKNKHNDPESYEGAKSNLKSAIRKSKDKYRVKLERIFASGDSKKLWANMNTITQYKGSKRSADTNDVTLPDKLNEFYARFDRDNNTTPIPLPIDTDTPPPFVINEHDVCRLFSRLNESKAAGPDNIRPRLLRKCALGLAPVFTFIFNWSIEICKVPLCYKMSNIIPVPKITSPKVLKDYRPVALTSCIMKCFEKLVLNYIVPTLPPDFDSHQFAYTNNRSIEDALAINCHEVLQHLETKQSYTRILFIDYSSAFNTIIPQKLYSKLLHDLKFPVTLCNWILDFLLHRPQVVKLGKLVSSSITVNTGTPQGCPLSPKLYSIFTYDCKADIPNNLIIKFADDTTVTGFINNNNENNYRDQVHAIVNWCDGNNLKLNVSKTKEMVIDFRRNKTDLVPLMINNTTVEQVNSFKFLGTFVTNDLSWNMNCLKLLTKARQRMYFLRKLKSFNVSQYILIQFYRAVVESILTHSIIVWYDKSTVYYKRRMQSVVRCAEKIINTRLPSLESIYIDRMGKKINKILRDQYHPAHPYFHLLPSNRRLRNFKGCKRLTNSFFPQAVKLYNGTRGQKS